MILGGFINKGTDERIIKEISKSIEPEILEKAIDKSKLVQKQITVQGKHGQYTKMAWVKAGDVKSTDRVIGGQQPDKSKPKDDGDKPIQSKYKVGDTGTITTKGGTTIPVKVTGVTMNYKDEVVYEVRENRVLSGNHSPQDYRVTEKGFKPLQNNSKAGGNTNTSKTLNKGKNKIPENFRGYGTSFSEGSISVKKDNNGDWILNINHTEKYGGDKEKVKLTEEQVFQIYKFSKISDTKYLDVDEILDSIIHSIISGKKYDNPIDKFSNKKELTEYVKRKRAEIGNPPLGFDYSFAKDEFHYNLKLGDDEDIAWDKDKKIMFHKKHPEWKFDKQGYRKWEKTDEEVKAEKILKKVKKEGVILSSMDDGDDTNLSLYYDRGNYYLDNEQSEPDRIYEDDAIDLIKKYIINKEDKKSKTVGDSKADDEKKAQTSQQSNGPKVMDSADGFKTGQEVMYNDHKVKIEKITEGYGGKALFDVSRDGTRMAMTLESKDLKAIGKHTEAPQSQKANYFKAEQATKNKVNDMSKQMGNDKLLQYAKDNGVTWKENDSKGINIMRMKMALAQAIQEGKIKDDGHEIPDEKDSAKYGKKTHTYRDGTIGYEKKDDFSKEEAKEHFHLMDNVIKANFVEQMSEKNIIPGISRSNIEFDKDSGIITAWVDNATLRKFDPSTPKGKDFGGKVFFSVNPRGTRITNVNPDGKVKSYFKPGAEYKFNVVGTKL